MSLSIDDVLQATRQIAKEVKDFQKNLTVQFVPHHAGQLRDSIPLAMPEISKHPANKTATQILNKSLRSETSRFLGIAIEQENIFFGLATRLSALALTSINLDQFSNIREVKRFAYHMAWHAIDGYEYYNDPKNRKNQPKQHVTRKRSALELTHANLKADVFSATASFYTGDKTAIEQINLMRCHNILCSVSGARPEFYAYAMAKEAAESAVEKVKAQHVSTRTLIATAKKNAEHAGAVYEKKALKSWLSFSKPAQDMSWRGHDKAEILGVAINTSPDTNVRSTAYMVAEALDIKPKSILDIRAIYSPFADEDYNKEIHKKAVRKTFIETFTRGQNTKSPIPLLEMANEQNERLTTGEAMGWCASTLQDAALTIETATKKGEAPVYDIEQHLTPEKIDSNWEALQKVGGKVVTENRQGRPVTMSRLDELTKEVQGTESIQGSIQQTIQDPGYQQKLQNIQATEAPQMVPQAPSLERELSMTPKTPAYTAEAAPTMGKAKIPPQTTTQTTTSQQQAEHKTAQQQSKEEDKK